MQENKTEKEFRILVAAPISNRHQHLIKDWIKNVQSFSVMTDILLVDNSLDKGQFYKKLKKIKGIKVLRHNWKPAKKMLDLTKWKKGYRHHLQMLAECREIIRKYFLSHKKYSHLFNLDTDVFPKSNYLEKLISYNKDQVGPIIHVYPKSRKHRAATFHGPKILFKRIKKKIKVDLEYYTFKELDIYKKMADFWLKNRIGFKPDDSKFPYLHKCYATSFGALLIKRRVLKIVPFRTHPTYIHGEDLWYYKEAFDKGFESFVDTSYRVPHKNVTWDTINKYDFNQYMQIKILRMDNNGKKN